jgi:L-threonylcarbamoyladenylate synthase
MPEIWRFDDEPSPIQFDEMARTLEEGKIVLLPTDTIYGLHAVAANAASVEGIAQLKGREETKPFIVLAASVAQLRSLGISASDAILAALDSIWPAPLTAILPLRAPTAASRGASTLAVRIPALGWLRALAERTGPLVSTSANRSAEPPIQRPSDLAQDMLDSISGIADRGIRQAEPSAILDLTGNEPRFIRECGDSFTQKVWKTLRNLL